MSNSIQHLKPFSLQLCVLIMILVCTVSDSWAFSPYKTAFNSRYGTTGTRLDTCATCHTSASSPGPLNPFGDAVLNRLGLGDAIGTALGNIESLDSDGDTYSNLTEINARTFPGNPSDFPVVTNPNIAVTPASLSFGSIVVGANSTLSVTITNSGNATLTVSSRSLTGNADFSFVSAPVAPFNIVAGSSATISVKYAPSTMGAASGTLAIASNDPDTSLVSVSLSGTGVACAAVVSPLALAFGEVALGDSASLMVTIVNNGTSTCSINGLTFTGSSAFHLGPSAPVTPFDLTPTSSVMIPVVFEPAVTGLASGTLQITSTDPDTPTTNISLTGSGGPPPSVCQLAFSPLSVSFGAVPVGTTGSTSITVTNKSTAACSVTSYNLTGSGDFAAGPGAPTTPFDVTPGTSAVIPLAYSPSAVGPASGTITVTGTDALNSSVNIPLSGTGVACNLGVAPSTLGFGTVIVGNSSTQSVTLTNSGALACSVTAMSISGSTDFQIGALAPTVPLTIAVGVSTNIPIAYTPQNEGNDNGLLSISSNDADQPEQSVILTGTGQIPSPECDLMVTPTSVEFGNVVVGANAQVAISIENIGSATCAITGVTVTGNADFHASVTTPLNLNPGASVAVNVDFAPSVVGTNTASMQISSTDAHDPTISVPLAGNGIQSALGISPSAVNFGIVKVGTKTSRILSIYNNGTANATVQSITINGNTAFSLGTGGPSSPFVVAPNAFVDVSIEYAPTEAGNQTATVVVTSDDPANPIVQVPLTGTGQVRTGKVDLDIVRFRVTERYEIESSDSPIRIRLVVKNNGRGAEEHPAKVVGVQNGVVVYRETIMISAPRGETKGFIFPPYTPEKNGPIQWTVRITDDNSDVDRATVTTIVRHDDDDDEPEDY